MDITVYIPTRERHGLAKQITLRELKALLPSIKPIIVCPVGEVQWHRGYGEDIEILGCPYSGIGPTRQWILENSKTRGVLMLDDDLYFSQRSPVEQVTPLVQSTDLTPLMQWISDQLDAGFVHGGISARQGNQHIPHAWTDCIRVNNAHFFDAEVYRELGIRFDRIPVMEDFDVTLQLLTKGYPNRVAYHYCWSQRGSGLSGGCSSYRTPDVQAQAAGQLYTFWPNFVEIVEKTAISGGSVFAGRPRIDVNIAWQKAWKASSRPLIPLVSIPAVNIKRR